VKFLVIQWIVHQQIYAQYYIQCYLMLNYLMIIYIYINHHAIVTNLYWFKTPFSVSFDCYVNIYIGEEEEKKRNRLFDFIHTFSIYLNVGGIKWTRLLHHHRERKNKNKKIFPIFNQTISYKWTVYPLDVQTLIVWINSRQKGKRTKPVTDHPSGSNGMDHWHLTTPLIYCSITKRKIETVLIELSFISFFFFLNFVLTFVNSTRVYRETINICGSFQVCTLCWLYDDTICIEEVYSF